jgi:DNA-binding response OmpR family regulator
MDPLSNIYSNNSEIVMRILFVENNERLAETTSASLRDHGFTVDNVYCGEDALLSVTAVRYDAIILDLGLPNIDGMTVLNKLQRTHPDTPVLVCTARDALDDRIKGLNAGSDDYLVKPFDTGELIARVRALLRRPGGALGLVLTSGNLAFDTIGREVKIGDTVARLSKREIDLLELLMRRKGNVVPKEFIDY